MNRESKSPSRAPMQAEHKNTNAELVKARSEYTRWSAAMVTSTLVTSVFVTKLAFSVDHEHAKLICAAVASSAANLSIMGAYSLKYFRLLRMELNEAERESRKLPSGEEELKHSD